MAELPLKEYEVYYTRTVHTYVRVAAKTAQAASKLAAQRVEEGEFGAMCAQCTGYQEQDVTIEEDENSEERIEIVEDPTEHVILVHDFDLVDDEDDDSDDEDEEDDDDGEDGNE